MAISTAQKARIVQEHQRKQAVRVANVPKDVFEGMVESNNQHQPQRLPFG